jgi:hypothetical protein
MMEHGTAWIAPALDTVLIALLALVLWRLGRDPSASWRTREQRLGEISADLRALVAQAEGLAGDLDGKLAAHHERLRAMMVAAETTARRAVEETEPENDIVERVRTLAATAMPVEEIARRLGVPVAEVRVLVGLRAARRASAPRGVTPGGKRST